MKNETARQEIESLDYYLQNHTDDYSEGSHTAMMMAIKALEQTKWIPVSERLPEKNGWYIVTKECGEYHFIDDAYFDGKNWLEQRLEWHKLVYAHRIIAWMTKPEPYMEEKALEQEDVLGKIREEIERRKKNSGGDPSRDLAFNVCLQIIDKYKAESEDKA